MKRYLDEARVDDLRQLAGEELDSIVERFFQRLEDRVADLKAALDDLPAAEACAHSLKGSAATLGADALAEHAFAIEQAARRNDRDAVSQLVHDLRRSCEHSRAAFVQYGFDLGQGDAGSA